MLLMKLPTLFLTLTVSVASTVEAALIVSQSTLPPSDLPLIAAHDKAATGGYVVHYQTASTSRRDVGQSFTLSSEATFKSITFYVYNFLAQAPGSEFTLTIYEADERNIAPKSDNSTAIFFEKGQLPADLATGYLNLTLSTGVNLTSGKHYSVVLNFDDYTTNRSLSLGTANDHAFDGVRWGSNHLGEGFTTGGMNSVKVVFYAYAEPIPEPSATLLLGLAGGALGLGWFKRRRL